MASVVDKIRTWQIKGELKKSSVKVSFCEREVFLVNCTAEWRPSVWGQCSRTCGDGGVQVTSTFAKINTSLKRSLAFEIC